MAPSEAPIFQCLAMLTKAVGPMLTRQMHEVLDLMFPWGMSEPLYNALQVIAEDIPPLLRTVQGEIYIVSRASEELRWIQSVYLIVCR